MNIGRDTAHHVVAGRDDWNRVFRRINVSEGFRQLYDTRQTLTKHFFAQVIQLQEHVVALLATAAAFEDFHDHGTRHDVTARQVFGVGRIALHETLAILVDQVATFTTATFGDQRARTVNTGRVELPHFHVLHREAGAQRHADTVTGVDQGVSGRRVDASSTAGRQHGGFRLNVHHFAGFDTHGDTAHHVTVGVLDQIHRVPLVQERGVVLQVVLVKGVQQRVTGTVGGGAGTCGLTTFTKVLGLTTERTLIDAAIVETRER